MKPPRFLLLDIETYPGLGWFWQPRETDIAINQIEYPPGVLCWSAKWLDERGTLFASLKKDGRSGMVVRMHALLSEADAVIHYNGKRFDVPLLNQEFLLAGLGPPAPFQQIDLYETARKFRFPYSKLEYILKVLNIGAKLDHEGFPLWRKCIGGKELPHAPMFPLQTYRAAWKTMEGYCKNDTEKMEPLYKRFLPWIKQHPNLNLFFERLDRPACPKCYSSKRVKADKRRMSQTGVYVQWKCVACQSWFADTRRSGGTTVKAAA